MSLLFTSSFGANFAQRPAESLFAKIDNLVDRRNEIAHGAESQILHNNEILEYSNFLKTYGKAIFLAIHNQELETFVHEKCIKVEDQDIKGVFKHYVVGIAISNHPIKLGDTVIVKSDNIFNEAKIINLQINNKNISKIHRKKKTKVGIELDIRISKRNKFFLLKCEPTNHPTIA